MLQYRSEVKNDDFIYLFVKQYIWIQGSCNSRHEYLMIKKLFFKYKN